MLKKLASARRNASVPRMLTVAALLGLIGALPSCAVAPEVHDCAYFLRPLPPVPAVPGLVVAKGPETEVL